MRSLHSCHDPASINATQRCPAPLHPVVQVSAVKGELACATNGEVLAELELRLCSRPGLNPLVVPLTDDGRALDRPLEVGEVGVGGEGAAEDGLRSAQ